MIISEVFAFSEKQPLSKLKKEFFISEGIGLDSVNSLKNLFKMNLPLYGIDVNSKFEDSNNRKIIKDLKKFKEIIENEI